MANCILRDGFKLNYRIDVAHPDAPWLVFGNSLMTDLSIWNDQVSALVGRWNMLRYDQRGHGGSAIPSLPPEIPALAQDLLAVIDAAGIARCVYVGLSMGVPTGLAAFNARSDLFVQMVFVDGQARSTPTGREFWEERVAFARVKGMEALADQTVARWLRPSRHGSPTAKILHKMIARTPLDGFIACALALRDYDESSVLSRLDIPVHFIAGAHDGAIPATMEAMARQVAGSNFTPVADAGHIPNFERPLEFNHMLMSVLNASQFRSEAKS